MTNKELVEKGTQYVMNTYARFPIAPVKGKGAHLWDADGKEYLDFLAGIAVCSLGHCNEELKEALQQQADTLWHASNLYWLEPQIKLAEKLVKLAGMGKAFFCNSGAEANEAAIKLARKYFYRQGAKDKNEIIVFKKSFHGRTLATVTATGQAKYQEGFAPLPGGFHYADYNNLASVENLINDKTCAIMLEPVQGEGGIYPAEQQFLQGIKDLCYKHKLLLIFDEVQCGVGRSGEFFAFETCGIKPDIVTMAKALGGGFPIGAMLATEEAATGFQPGDHASTFGGNPLATAVACKVVDIISDQEFLKQVKQNAAMLTAALTAIQDGRMVTVRGRGLMIGIEFSQEVRGLIQACMQKGLLVGGAGPNVLRFVPPLNISAAEIDQAVAILKQALQEWQ